jgi:hypothetical protein
MDPSSLQTVAMHLGHFERTLGKRLPICERSLADLQRHVNRRPQAGSPKLKRSSS